jgi:hypothetical protein
MTGMQVKFLVHLIVVRLIMTQHITCLLDVYWWPCGPDLVKHGHSRGQNPLPGPAWTHDNGMQQMSCPIWIEGAIGNHLQSYTAPSTVLASVAGAQAGAYREPFSSSQTYARDSAGIWRNITQPAQAPSAAAERTSCLRLPSRAYHRKPTSCRQRK